MAQSEKLSSNGGKGTLVETLASPEEGRRASACTPAERRYSWLILLLAFLLNLVMNATTGGMGVIMVELTHHFRVPRSVILSIGGVMMSVGFISSVFIAWLISKFGCRWTGCIASLVAAGSHICTAFAENILTLYIFYGFILGLSVAFYWNIASIIIQQYFDRRRSLAQGMLMSGMSGGLFIWPPLTRYMMDIYGWRGAMLLHAGIQLHGMVLCALIRPVPTYHYQPTYQSAAAAGDASATISADGKAENHCEHFGERAPLDGAAAKAEHCEVESEALNNCSHLDDDSHSPGGQSGKDTRQGKTGHHGMATSCFHAMFKVVLVFPHYLLYMLAVAMVQTGNVMPYTLTPARADALGIDKHLGALMVTVVAGVSGVCRVLCGLVADHPAINHLVLCGSASVVAGVLTALTTLLTTFTSLVIAFAVIGVPSAVFMSTFGTAGIDIAGKRFVQQGIGLMSVAFGIAQLSTFLGTGWLNDVFGDPKYGFLVFGVTETLGGFVFLATYVVDKRARRHLGGNTSSSYHLRRS